MMHNRLLFGLLLISVFGWGQINFEVSVSKKQLGLNEGSEIILVKGVIRPEDIMPNNTVLSTRLANAQFSYNGVGELARATKSPWGVKVLYGLWPF